MDRREFIEGAAAAAALGMAADAGVVTFASTRLSVQVRGVGPDVILVPGLTQGRGVWSGTVAALPGYRYHLVQVAGFAGDPAGGNASGRVVASVAEEVARYIRDQRLERPAVIGHSMGGIVALMVAARHPARVGKVMAVDILPVPASGFGFAGLQVGPFADLIFNGLRSTPEGRRTLDNLIDRYGGTAISRSRSDRDVVARATHELATTDLTPELARITAPLTVVYATPASAQEAAVVTARYRQGYAAVKAARLRPIAGSGHMIMFDRPALFQAELKTFLARL